MCPIKRDNFYLVQKSRFWTKSKQSVLNKTNSGTISKHFGFVSKTISESLSSCFWHYYSWGFGNSCSLALPPKIQLKQKTGRSSCLFSGDNVGLRCRCKHELLCLHGKHVSKVKSWNGKERICRSVRTFLYGTASYTRNTVALFPSPPHWDSFRSLTSSKSTLQILFIILCNPPSMSSKHHLKSVGLRAGGGNSQKTRLSLAVQW